MSGPAPRLVLIEPYADRVGGHYQHTMYALAAAGPDSLIVTPPRRRGPAAHLLAGGAAMAQVLATGSSAVLGPRWWPDRLRRLPHQIELLRRCLVEAACLRSARHEGGSGCAVVILTASEGLHLLAAALGGGAHLRFVHEVTTTEDLPLRLLGKLFRRRAGAVGLVCPTEAVARQLRPRFPVLATAVRTYAVDDGQQLTDAEIDGARDVFGIPADATVVCLVGGWWPHKDIATLDAALARLRKPLHLLVTGHPIDQQILDRWRGLPLVRLCVEPGPVPEQILRLVYAAADASLVIRHRGVGKESGLVLGAARLGVPLIVSGHDLDLTHQLIGHRWVRVFPAGSPVSLAMALDGLSDERMPRPPASAGKSLGMATPSEQAAFLVDTYRRLSEARR
ncbi:hypothetical protein [Nocardia africana]|uniref:Glycosyl transferases group 1 n=1 Tax=Nocardia africana TaxID=134964 RepID=A0A378X4D7_9NOCA|nr:hypothetical protein [Nocardia africana]MCC3318350.1 hypothetical protein [Nocardia africana]SUA47413.1 Uncharacterised protein [Nocardia africana]